MHEGRKEGTEEMEERKEGRLSRKDIKEGRISRKAEDTKERRVSGKEGRRRGGGGGHQETKEGRMSMK
jgi:hypothetical protein